MSTQVLTFEKKEVYGKVTGMISMGNADAYNVCICLFSIDEDKIQPVIFDGVASDDPYTLLNYVLTQLPMESQDLYTLLSANKEEDVMYILSTHRQILRQLMPEIRNIINRLVEEKRLAAYTANTIFRDTLCKILGPTEAFAEKHKVALPDLTNITLGRGDPSALVYQSKH